MCNLSLPQLQLYPVRILRVGPESLFDIKYSIPVFSYNESCYDRARASSSSAIVLCFANAVDCMVSDLVDVHLETIFENIIDNVLAIFTSTLGDIHKTQILSSCRSSFFGESFLNL